MYIARVYSIIISPLQINNTNIFKTIHSFIHSLLNIVSFLKNSSQLDEKYHNCEETPAPHRHLVPMRRSVNGVPYGTQDFRTPGRGEYGLRAILKVSLQEHEGNFWDWGYWMRRIRYRVPMRRMGTRDTRNSLTFVEVKTIE